MNIGIIGGGREGLWWKRFLEKAGHDVSVSDCATDNASIVADADVVVLAVPMSVAANVTREIVTVMRTEQLFVSVCGIMTPVEKALAAFSGDVVFLHRMIGPQVETMQGHHLAVNRLRLGIWREFAEALLERTEGTIVHVTSEEHDEMVGLTQAMVRIILLAFGKLILGTPHAIEFANLPFVSLVLVLTRILDFGSVLSRDMVFENPSSGEWIEKLHTAMLSVEGGSQTDFNEMFEKLKLLIGSESVKEGSKVLAGVPPWWK